MPEFQQELERMVWLSKQQGFDMTQPCKVVLPRVDAKERIRNAKKVKRITINTDADGVSEYAAIKEAWFRELNDNPSLYFAAVLEALRTFDVRGWKETQESEGA